MSLLSWRLKSLVTSSAVAKLRSFDDFELFARPRGLEQMSHTTLADEFS